MRFLRTEGHAQASLWAPWKWAVFALCLCGCGSNEAPPSILLVTIDTCRADRIGCYGGSVETTHIDAIAERGTLFEQATAPAPLTLPSHLTILTGLYPDRHSVRDNGAGRLPASARTVAEILGERGWRTAAFVSAFPLDSAFGSDQGFEVYDDDFSETAAGDLTTVPEDTEDVAKTLFYDERLATQVTDRAIPWIEERAKGDEPFLAWVHYFDPHATYRPPARHAELYGAGSYEGEIAYVDEQVGRLLEALGSAREYCTVVVTADHGESLGEHEEQTHGLFVYESSLRVPWVMSGPAVPSRRRVEEPVSLACVAPTLLEAVGVEIPPDLDGESVLTEADEALPVFAECLFPRIHYDWAALRSVRRGKWKLIEAPRPELFDLSTDPDELNNVAADHPDIVESLRSELIEQEHRGGELADLQVGMDEETMRRLEALGYVGGSSAGASDRLASDLWNQSGRDPKDMVGFFNRLQMVPTHMLSGNYARAETLLNTLNAEDPNNRNVLEKFALLRRFQERWEEAAEFCRQVLEIDPEDVQIRKNLGFSELKCERFDRAREEYERVVTTTPDDSDAWIFLASAWTGLGNNLRAIQALEEAVRLEPKRARFRVELATAWQDSGVVARAIAEYDRALEIDPTSSAALNGKGLLLSHEGRKNEAVEVLRAGLVHIPNDIEALNNLAWILANDSIAPEEGFEVAQRAARLAPDDPAVLDTLGWAATRSGRPSVAIRPLTKAWEATRDAEVRLHLGVALAEAGRTSEGRAHVRAAIAERASLSSIPEASKWR